MRDSLEELVTSFATRRPQFIVIPEPPEHIIPTNTCGSNPILSRILIPVNEQQQISPPLTIADHLQHPLYLPTCTLVVKLYFVCDEFYPIVHRRKVILNGTEIVLAASWDSPLATTAPTTVFFRLSSG